MLFSEPCAIVDLETTGGHLARDRVTEMGIILLDGESEQRFSYLVNPEQPIPPFIVAMTGISNEMVASAPLFAALATELFALLAGRTLIAHNVRFDYGVLKNEFKRVGINYQSPTLCTVKLSRKLYPQHYKHNLDAIMARHHIQLPERHRAMADAEAVYQFLHSAADELGAPHLQEAILTLQGQNRAPAGLDQETFEALPDVPGVFWFEDANGLALYVGRDLNIRRGVLAHFTPANRRVSHQLAGVACKVYWRETVGAFGAALLELIQLRALEPRLNARGRHARELCTIQLLATEDGWLRPEIVAAGLQIQAGAGGCHGLFSSAREARKALKALALSSGLCQSRLACERITSRKGEPCEGRRQGRCHGACIGQESAALHNARLEQALARLDLPTWPYPGAIAIVEHDPVLEVSCEHYFDKWRYLGSHSVGGLATPWEAVTLLDPELNRLLLRCFAKPQEGVSIKLRDA